MADDSTGLLGGQNKSGSTTTADKPLYHDSSQTQTAKLAHLSFVIAVVIMVIITIILSIYRSVIVPANGGLYVMMGLCLVGFAALEVIMIIFLKRGELPDGKAWFLYFVGGCVILQAIFTDILLFQN